MATARIGAAFSPGNVMSIFCGVVTVVIAAFRAGLYHRGKLVALGVSVLLVTSTPAAARWTELQRLDEGKIVWYFDSDSVVIDGSTVRVWVILNAEGEAKTKGSQRFLHEYDCKQRRYRVLSWTSFPGPMASGKPSNLLNEATEWKFVEPQGLPEQRFSRICGLLAGNASSSPKPETAPTRWVLLGKNQSGTHSVYIAPDSLRLDGSARRVWELINFEKPERTGRHSVRVHNEFDCKGRRYRSLSFSAHSGPMGGGDVLYQEHTADAWVNIEAGTFVESRLDYFCGGNSQAPARPSGAPSSDGKVMPPM